jgi:hypothetical protein
MRPQVQRKCGRRPGNSSALRYGTGDGARPWVAVSRRLVPIRRCSPLHAQSVHGGNWPQCRLAHRSMPLVTLDPKVDPKTVGANGDASPAKPLPAGPRRQSLVRGGCTIRVRAADESVSKIAGAILLCGPKRPPARLTGCPRSSDGHAVASFLCPIRLGARDQSYGKDACEGAEHGKQNVGTVRHPRWQKQLADFDCRKEQHRSTEKQQHLRVPRSA